MSYSTTGLPVNGLAALGQRVQIVPKLSEKTKALLDEVNLLLQEAGRTAAGNSILQARVDGLWKQYLPTQSILLSEGDIPPWTPAPGTAQVGSRELIQSLEYIRALAKDIISEAKTTRELVRIETERRELLVSTPGAGAVDWTSYAKWVIPGVGILLAFLLLRR